MKKNMLVRIAVGLGLAALFIGLWFAIGFMGKSGEWYSDIIQRLAFIAVDCLCVYEMTRALSAKGLKVTGIAYFAAIAWTWNGDIKEKAFYVFLLALMSIALHLFSKKFRYEDLFAELAVYVYPGLPLACLLGVCTGETVQMTQIMMLVTFACPLFGDTLAYFFGVTMGKRKLCEHISPKKTIAGSIGGVLGGTLAGFCCWALQPMIDHVFCIEQTTYALWGLVALGFVLGIVGQIGDLFASAVKRFAGVKDFGSLFPGHGGMLDRIDSVLMCAPVVLFAFYYLL